MATSKDQYAFGHDEAELRRLQMQGAFFDPLTRSLFGEIGIGAGMRVLDIGCGAGDVTMLAAEMVGDAGEVVGIDRAERPLRVAEARAAERGLSRVRFLQGDENTAADLAAGGRFDAVVGRCVLVHQRDPAAFLGALARVVRPGGVIAFQDPDFTIFLRTDPSIPLLEDVRGWIVKGHELIHARWDISLHTARSFSAAGLPAPRQRLHCPVLVDGHGVVFQIAAAVLRTMLPILAEKGAVDPVKIDVDTLAARMDAASRAHGGPLQTISMADCWSRISG